MGLEDFAKDYAPWVGISAFGNEDGKTFSATQVIRLCRQREEEPNFGEDKNNFCPTIWVDENLTLIPKDWKEMEDAAEREIRRLMEKMKNEDDDSLWDLANNHDDPDVREAARRVLKLRRKR